MDKSLREKIDARVQEELERKQAYAAKKRAKAAQLFEEALVAAPHRWESKRMARWEGRSEAHSDRLLKAAAHAEAYAAELERKVAERKARRELAAEWRARRGNPGGGGLSFVGLALGLALGAAAMHFKMKPNQ